MSALSKGKTYDGRADISVAKVQELDEAFAKEQFPNNKHGLLIYDGAGEVIGKLEGHQFGAAEVESAIDAALSD